jgi:microcystin-dependent protein
MVALTSWASPAEAVCTPLGTTTPGLGLCKPNNGEVGWTNAINGNWDILDAAGRVPSGAVMFYAGAASPAGWYACDGSAKNRTGDAALFAAIGTTFGAGDGSTTFNLPDMRSRVPMGAGQGTFVTSAASTSVNVTTDEITVQTNESLQTGTAIVLTTSGSAPAPLAAGTTYYVIRVSPTSVKLATSLSSAVAGTAINLTTQGSGTHSLTATYTTRNLGDRGGEETHAITVTEMPAHSHSYTTRSTGAAFTSPTGRLMADAASSNTGSTGGNGSHNVMDPFLVLTCMIKR